MHIDYCIQKLNEQPKWIFQKENINLKLQYFDIIQEIGVPDIINRLISFLRSDNTLTRNKAAETIIILSRKLKSLNDYESSLKYLQIVKADLDFYKTHFDTKTYAGLLAIASVNGSGYIREKAVSELGGTRDAGGLKVILFRLGDWVPAVRAAATRALVSYLSDEYIGDLLPLLPTIDWLLDIQRVDLGDVHRKIVQFIASRELTAQFLNEVSRLNDRARRSFYRVVLDNKALEGKQINRIASDKNFMVRLEVLKHLPAFATSVQRELVKHFLYDKSVRVQLNALYASKSFSPAFDEQIQTLLSDEAASVRELSRSLLKGKGIDFISLYLQRIENGQTVAGSLAGLAEVGGREYLDTFIKIFQSRETTTLVPCLIAVNKFDRDKAAHLSMTLLDHPARKVRNKAIEILAGNVDAHMMTVIREMYTTAEEKTKKDILTLYSKIGGWYVFGDLLLALTDSSTHIQNLAWGLLYRWRHKAMRIFTTASKDELARANRIYSTLDVMHLRMTNNQAELLQSLKCYLQ